LIGKDKTSHTGQGTEKYWRENIQGRGRPKKPHKNLRGRGVTLDF